MLTLYVMLCIVYVSLDILLFSFIGRQVNKNPNTCLYLHQRYLILSLAFQKVSFNAYDIHDKSNSNANSSNRIAPNI